MRLAATPAKGRRRSRALLAGVEDRQAERALVGEHRPEVHAAHLPAAPVVLLEQQQAVLPLGVEDAVPDEVEDVVVVAP